MAESESARARAEVGAELANEREIVTRQLKWLTLYLSELSKLEQPGMPIDRVQEVRRLRSFVPHHTQLHASLLQDALISGLYALFETAGWDQKAGDSQKITLEHFIRKLPTDFAPRAAAEKLLKEVRLSSSYAQLCRARGDIISHSNRKTLLAFVDQPTDTMFPDLGIDNLGLLLRKAQQIASAVVDPSADFAIPDFRGVDELFEIVRAAITPSG